jgi:hypothetical protein
MDSAAVARDVNAHMYEVAVRFGADARFDFLCECGCLEPVSMSAADYRAGRGARLPEHSAESSGPDSVAA